MSSRSVTALRLPVARVDAAQVELAKIGAEQSRLAGQVKELELARDVYAVSAEHVKGTLGNVQQRWFSFQQELSDATRDLEASNQ